MDKLVESKIRPVVLERGGDIGNIRVEGNHYIINILGSPGAALPLQNQISALIRHYINTDAIVKLICGADKMEFTPVASRDNSREDRINLLLQTQINPAIVGHRGEIRLDKIENDLFSCFSEIMNILILNEDFILFKNDINKSEIITKIYSELNLRSVNELNLIYSELK